MDPLTALGAVASVAQLAATALSLSKTLYSLGAAIASASDDIQVLADDLKTFSQSLTLLSRLLEDSKSWYSDDIYLLTAKIIRDCAELYIKIDKILVKLGGNGKSTWKLRVKFVVYKEGQIRKLLNRLRDMKGTLATILMSLQVDLQLSLLNISSSSKIQRPAEKPLEPETLRTLKQAQEAVEAGGFLPKYTVHSEQVVLSSEGVELASTRYEISSQIQCSNIVGTSSAADGKPFPTLSRGLDSNNAPFSNPFNVTQSFAVLPSLDQGFPPVIARDTAMTPVSTFTMQDLCWPGDRFQNAGGMNREQGILKKGKHSTDTKMNGSPTRSLKSSSSTESFKSAMSLQEEDLNLARKVKAVQSVMHAFRTALEILNNLVDRRIHDKHGELYFAAKKLEDSLDNGSKAIDRKHISHFKQHGQSYIQLFTEPRSARLQSICSNLMAEVVMKLHEYSAEHEDLQESCFEALYSSSENICRRVLHYLNQVVHQLPVKYALALADEDDPVVDEVTLSAEIHPQFKAWPHPNEETRPKLAFPIRHHTGTSYFHKPQLSHPTSKSHTTASSLPFIGYTFKRFDDSTGSRRLNNEVPQHISPPTNSNIARFNSNGLPLSNSPEATQSPRHSAAGLSLAVALTEPSFPPMPATNKSLSPLPVSNPATQQMSTPHRGLPPPAAMALPQPGQQSRILFGNSAPLDRLNIFTSNSSSSEDESMPPAPPSDTLAFWKKQQVETISFNSKQEPSILRPEQQSFFNDGQQQVAASLPPASGLDAHYERFESADPTIYEPPPGFLAETVIAKYMENRAGAKNDEKKGPDVADKGNLDFEDMGANGMRGGPGDAPAGVGGNHALQDHQTQLMLLGQQNKKILMMARQEQDNMMSRTDEPSSQGGAPRAVKPNGQPFPGKPVKPRKFRSSCNACSASKVKCNQEQPRCTRCTNLGINCNYSPPQRMGKPPAAARKPTPSPKLTTTALQTADVAFEFEGHMDFATPADETDMLQNFDFDSFLHQDGEPMDFTFDTAAFPDGLAQSEKDNSNNELLAEEQTTSSTPRPAPTTSAFDEDGPLYVNKKQFHRILKRRVARDKLVEKLKAQSSRPQKRWLHSPPSFNVQRVRRPRGQFLTREEIAENDKREELEPQTAIQQVITNEPTYASSITKQASQPDHVSSQDYQPTNIELSSLPRQTELAPAYPALSHSQLSKLWWQAYISLCTTHPTSFRTVAKELRSELGLFATESLSDEWICKRISTNIKRIGTALHGDKLNMDGMLEIMEMRGNAIRIMTTVESQLGLEAATLGWTCVWTFLAIHEYIFASSQCEAPETMQMLKTSFTNLQDMVAIIARYAVMDNLYHQTRSALSLSLKPEYQSSLVGLCSTVLQFFATSFELGRKLSQINVGGKHGEEELLKRCGELINEIKKMDRECQGFRVLVDTVREESSDSGSEDIGIEDVSDEGWEVVDAGVIGGYSEAGVD